MSHHIWICTAQLYLSHRRRTSKSTLGPIITFWSHSLRVIPFVHLKLSDVRSLKVVTSITWRLWHDVGRNCDIFFSCCKSLAVCSSEGVGSRITLYPISLRRYIAVPLLWCVSWGAVGVVWVVWGTNISSSEGTPSIMPSALRDEGLWSVGGDDDDPRLPPSNPNESSDGNWSIYSLEVPISGEPPTVLVARVCLELGYCSEKWKVQELFKYWTTFWIIFSKNTLNIFFKFWIL